MHILLVLCSMIINTLFCTTCHSSLYSTLNLKRTKANLNVEHFLKVSKDISKILIIFFHVFFYEKAHYVRSYFTLFVYPLNIIVNKLLPTQSSMNKRTYVSISMALKIYSRIYSTTRNTLKLCHRFPNLQITVSL